jgi:hypothetical protein
MEPNVFLGYMARGIVGVLSSFGHGQYLFKSDINPWCLIIKYLNEGIGFLVSFGRAMQYPVMCQKICYWNPMYFWDTSRGVLQVY